MSDETVDQPQAEELAAEVARHDKVTKVARGLRDTRQAREEIRKGGKPR